MFIFFKKPNGHFIKKLMKPFDLQKVPKIQKICVKKIKSSKKCLDILGIFGSF